MKPHRAFPDCLGRLVIGVFCAYVLLPALSFGQVIWDNSNADNRWGTAANWNSNAVPGTGSNVQFNATDFGDATVSDVELRGSQNANSITFNNVDDAFSIINGTGNRTLNLTSGAITRTAGSSGIQTIANDTLALGANSIMNIDGTGNLSISATISGTTRSLTKTGAGELILSGTNTFSGGTIVSAGTLTLASASALGSGSTLTLSGGTLKLSTTGTTVTNLNVTANSTIDFGGANASLNITNLSVTAGVTLNIINWVNATDAFITTAWVGATQDTIGAAPMNRVVFSGFTGDNTAWESIDNRIRPIPEPSTYGALLLGAVTGLMFWRRRRQARSA
jgi:autotransporter-associated beta strand protein